MEELEAEKARSQARVQSLKKRKADLSVSTDPSSTSTHSSCTGVRPLTRTDPLVADHGGDEAAGARVL